MELNKKLFNNGNLKITNINILKKKIRTNIKKKRIKNLLTKQRRVMTKRTLAYTDLNKIIRKKGEDLRHFNTELFKSVVEKNKNMKVIKTGNTNERARIHELE